MTSPQIKQSDPPFQYSLRALLIFITITALLLGLSITFNIIEAFAAIAVVFVSWLMLRWAKADKNGIVFWCIATEMMVFAAIVTRITFVLVSEFGSIIENQAFSELLGICCYFYGVFVVCCYFLSILFFFISIKNSKTILINSISLILTLITPMLFCSGITAYHETLRIERDKQEASENTIAKRTIVSDIEEACSKLGSVPKDENEIIAVLGRTLPHLHFRGREQKFLFHYIASNQFSISYCNGDIYTYDSQTPNQGWVRTPF